MSGFRLNSSTQNVLETELPGRVNYIQQGVIQVQVVANVTTAGNTAFVDYFTGDAFLFEEEDIALACFSIGSNLNPFAGDVAIGTSLTEGGAIVDTFTNTTVANMSAAQSDYFDTRCRAATSGLYLSCNFSGGVTSGSVRAVITIWRRSITQ